MRWHTQALAGKAVEVTHDPQPGFFKRRLRPKCCWVPVRIWMRQETDDAGDLISDEKLLCTVDGEPRDPGDQWTYCCTDPISEREFNYLTRLRAWQRVNAPEEWDPFTPIDHTRTPIIEEN